MGNNKSLCFFFGPTCRWNAMQLDTNLIQNYPLSEWFFSSNSYSTFNNVYDLWASTLHVLSKSLLESNTKRKIRCVAYAEWVCECAAAARRQQKHRTMFSIRGLRGARTSYQTHSQQQQLYTEMIKQRKVSKVLRAFFWKRKTNSVLYQIERTRVNCSALLFSPFFLSVRSTPQKFRCKLRATVQMGEWQQQRTDFISFNY